jgi:hypothetical protein
VAGGFAPADALSGGASMGTAGGPLLLVAPTAPLPPAISSYFQAVRGSVTTVYAFGGAAVVGDDILAAISSALT